MEAPKDRTTSTAAAVVAVNQEPTAKSSSNSNTDNGLIPEQVSECASREASQMQQLQSVKGLLRRDTPYELLEHARQRDQASRRKSQAINSEGAARYLEKVSYKLLN